MGQFAQNLYRLAAGVEGTLQVLLTAGGDVQGSVNLSVLCRRTAMTVLVADPSAGVGPDDSETLDIPVTQGEVVLLQVSGNNLSSAQGSFTPSIHQLRSVRDLRHEHGLLSDRRHALVARGRQPQRRRQATFVAGVQYRCLRHRGRADQQRRWHLPGGKSICRWSRPQRQLSAGTRQLQVADFNADGIPDVIVPGISTLAAFRCSWATATARSSPSRHLRRRGRAQSRFVRHRALFTGSGLPGCDRGCKGFLANGSRHLLLPAQRLGNEDFAPPVTYQTVFTQGVSAIVTGDFNGDGKLDLIVFSFNDSEGEIFASSGNGTFPGGRVRHSPRRRPSTPKSPT